MDIRLSSLLLILLISVCSSSVPELAEDTFDDEVNSKNLLMVKFYVPWCPHCQKLGPKFEKAAKLLRNDGNSGLAAVDCDAHKDLCHKYDVRGYPTILVFKKDGKYEEYDGSQSAKKMARYVVNNE